ncbi:unnamed protein product [Brassica rapa subsp. narinosa]|uniref:Uncharacterized protein n=2 Tax=Brassica TaxID=3705 RepID=A0A3P6AZQ5_BRACM|nr:unnamed protein product [Brassica napus]VDC93483.1 unnamed protein product [Brassica rapa]
MIVCHEILPTEARHLRTHRKLIKNRTTTPRAQGGSVALISEEEHGVDEFRPTTPGNSPGIGHSIKT